MGQPDYTNFKHEGIKELQIETRLSFDRTPGQAQEFRLRTNNRNT